jgi:hypothetical protein
MVQFTYFRAMVLAAAIAATAPEALYAQKSTVTAELRKLLDADQNVPYPDNVPTDSAARVAFFTAEWTKHFKPRQDRVVVIVRDGLLKTGEDYFIAGTIFNHGIKPEDNLMAHASARRRDEGISRRPMGERRGAG